MPFLPPNQQCQSTEGKQMGRKTLTLRAICVWQYSTSADTDVPEYFFTFYASESNY